MKILLINPPALNTLTANIPEILDQERGFIPPLGLMYVAAYLEKNSSHEVKILDCQLEKLDWPELEKKIIDEKPDVAGITAMTFTLIDVIKTAGIIKKINRNIKVVLGGPHIHIYPEETINIPAIDFLVLDEGEITFKELVEALSANQPAKDLSVIKGIVFKNGEEIINTGYRELIQNLDKLPFPARHLLPYQKYFSVLSSASPITTAFSSRGCPYQCTFCNRPHLGKIFRARSAKNVVDEMEECQKMSIKEILFYDDTFGVDRQRVSDICEEIKKRNLTIFWDIRTRVNTVDEEILNNLKKAGCQRIHYGVEAGTQKILNILKKGITLEQAENAFKITKKAGIQTLGYFMIGSPTETEKDIMETIKFMKKLDPDFVHVAITTPYPATALYLGGLQKKVFPCDYWREFAKNPKSDFVPLLWEENLSREKLISLLKKAYRSFYLRPSYIIKKILKLKSGPELIRKFKIAFRLIFNPSI